MANAAARSLHLSEPEDSSHARPSGSEGAWPSVHSRRSNSQETASVVDPADATAWSMPYTDLTMLLMVFFIVMLSIIGPQPAEKTEEVDNTSAADVAQATDLTVTEQLLIDRKARVPVEGSDGILTDGAGLMPDGGSARVVPEVAPTAETPNTVTATERPQDPPSEVTEDAFAQAWARRVGALEDRAVEFLGEAGLENTITLKRTDVGIELRLPDDLLFSSGSAEVQIEGMDLLNRITPLLAGMDGDIQVSGHTDNVPIQTVRFPSNWELSAARAIAVVRLLREMGLPERKMQAVGHGANRPIASNSHSVGRSINRRVTIDVTPRPSAR